MITLADKEEVETWIEAMVEWKADDPLSMDERD